MNAFAPEFIVRFFGRTELNSETGCMEWQGAITKTTGYGKVKLGDRVMDTHRASWIVTHGDIAEGMQICHSCDNRKCVNPRHLFLGTRSDNMVDAQLKGHLNMAGVRAAAKPKLTEGDVREIYSRINAGETRDSIAARFGVNRTTISKIRYKRLARYAEILAEVEAA